MAEGTRVGTGFVDIRPDFSRFQEAVAKRLEPQLRDIGRRANRSLAKDLAAKKNTQDMFGLSGAVRDVERRSVRASRASKTLGRDMFSVSAAAKRSGRSIHSASGQLRQWHMRSEQASEVSRRLGDRLRALAPQLRRLGREARTAAGNFDGFRGGIGRVNRDFQFFRNIMRTIKWPLLIASLGLAAQGLSALAAGAVAATSALAPLAGALIVLPAAAAAAAQGIAAVKLATAGVGDAIKASLDAQTEGGAQAVDVMRQQRDAADQVAQAERSLGDAQRQAKIAQEELTDARSEARRELEDMRLTAQRSHDTEQQAALSLQQARQELRRTLRDTDATPLDVRLAEEAVDQSRHDLTQTRLDAKRARKDYREAQKSGVEGMPQVVAAKRAEQDATRAVTDAQQGLQRATEDSTAAMEEQGSAASTLQEKMSQLPMAARAFVREIVGLKPKLDVLRETAASGFFPGATRGLRALMKNFGPVRGIVDETAKALGGLAERAGRSLGSAEWGRDLRKIGKGNTRILERMGEAVGNLADAFRHILVAAQPFLDWLSESIVSFTEWIEGEAEAGRKTGELAEFFDRVRKSMELVGPILKGVGGALLNVFEAARPLGNSILKALGGAAEGWREWTGSVEGQNSLARYFEEAKPAIFQAGKLIGAIGKAFFELGRQPGVANLLRLIRTELIPAMTDMFGALTGFASEFIKEFGKLRKQGVPGFEAFLQVLAKKAGQAGGKIAEALWNAFRHSSTLGKAVIVTWLLHKFIGLKVIGKAGARLGLALGQRFVTAAATWIAGTQAGAGLIGWFQGTFGPGGRFGKASRTAGMRMGRLFGRAFGLGVVVGLALVAPAIGRWIETNITDPIRDKIKEALNFDLGGVEIPLGDVASFDVFDPLGVFDGGEVPAAKTDKAERAQRRFEQSTERLRKGVGRDFGQVRKDARRHLDPIPGIAGRSGEGMNRQFLPEADRLRDRGGDKVKAFADGVVGNYRGMGIGTTGAVKTMMENTNRALKALGVKVIGYTVKGFPNTTGFVKGGPKGARNQRGGELALATGGLAGVVPGNITGDRHTLALNGTPVAKVESKEGIFVGNRKLMAVMQRANAAIPRFQGGGMLAGLAPGARSLASNLLDRFGGYVSSGLRPGDDGFHGRGMAVDWVGGNWPGAARYMNSIGPSLLEGIYTGAHGGPPVSWDSGSRVPSSFWESEWANHASHIHGAASGAVKAAIRKIGRLMLTGPDGPLKQLGQTAMDKVWKAANRFIAQKSSMGRHVGGDLQATGNGADLMRKIAEQRGWNFAHWWELDRRETGHGADIFNESSGAALRGQFMPGITQGHYGPGSDPSQNPTMGQQILAMAEYIAERYGDPSAALTHHDSHNWYKRGGLVEAMQSGGLVGLQGGGGQPKGDGKRKYAPMQRHLERFKNLGLGAANIAELTRSRIQRLAGLSERAEQFSEWASNASSLTFEDQAGNTIQGEFQGGVEGHWLLQQLQALGSLRNELIAAQEVLTAAKERAEKLIEQAKKQLERLGRQIFKGQQQRNKLMGSLRGARQALSNARDDKDPKRRQGRMEQARQSIAKLSERLVHVDFRQAQRRALVAEIKDKTLPNLRERLTGVSNALIGTVDGGEGFIGLKQVQGLSGPMNQIGTYGANSPAIGTLGGEILNVQSRLREIRERKTTSADDGEEKASLFERLFRDEQSRRFASDAHRVVLEGWDKLRQGIFAGLPKFHMGGVVPGPRSSEVPIMAKGGEVVLTPDQMNAAGLAQVIVNGDITQAPGDTRDPVEVVLGDRRFAPAVETVVRRAPGTGRKHPSAFSVR